MVGDTCTGAALGPLQPGALSWWFSVGHGHDPCAAAAAGTPLCLTATALWDARAHLSLQTKLSSSTVILQITGLLDHHFKALKLVLSFSFLFI